MYVKIGLWIEPEQATVLKVTTYARDSWVQCIWLPAKEGLKYQGVKTMKKFWDTN